MSAAEEKGLGGKDPFSSRRQVREAARNRASGGGEDDSEPPTATPAAAHTADTGAPPMPPARRRNTARVQRNVRIPVALNDRLEQHLDATSAAAQDVVEMALEEYLSRRNG